MLHNSGGIIFLGGLLAIMATIGEFLLGNAFSMVIFGVYGGFFLAYGATLIPWFNAYIAYAKIPTDDHTGSLILNDDLSPLSVGFLAAFGKLTMGCL
jgi:succinate-acetate transporter protein